MGQGFAGTVWRRLTYVTRLRRRYRSWVAYGLSPRMALRRAREDC